MYTFEVLFDGYSYMKGDIMKANCSCTLIKGPFNILVDSMTSWDARKLLDALNERGIDPNNINFVVSTHGHSDHIGNNNLFLKATHIVGFSISHEDNYYRHDFEKGEEYVIDSHVKVIPTPGHTLSDVTVMIQTKDNEKVAVVGDLFECYEDIKEPKRWLDAGSENPELQKKSRLKIIDQADWIIPGHGPMFRVTSDIRNQLHSQ